jgi:2-polyprenyl-3-methyl-5-hydroxy-6-metoxy-1,4-benzoquinol methylase
MWFKKRSEEEEIMDDLSCPKEDLYRTLDELGRVNRLLGGSGSSINAFSYLLTQYPDLSQLKVADVGCGGGDVARDISKFLNKRSLSHHVVGLDFNPQVIAYAKGKAQLPTVSYQVADVLSADFEWKGYDVAHFALILHHFTHAELDHLFSRMANAGVRFVIINDLERSRIAHGLFKIFSRLLSFSHMAKEDGLISIRKAFRKKELLQLHQDHGYHVERIGWRWAFRWLCIAELGTLTHHKRGE